LKVEKEKLTALHKREESELDEKGRRTKEAIAELVVAREQLLNNLTEHKQKESALVVEQAGLEKEINIYKEGLSAHRCRIRDKQSLHRIRMRDLISGHNGNNLNGNGGGEWEDVRVLEQRCEDRCLAMKEREHVWDNEMGALEKSHRDELASLDGQVKDEVKKREEMVVALREQIEEEQIKRLKFENLIENYEKNKKQSFDSKTIAASSVSSNNRKKK
jgi:hypothetical protein